MDIFKRISIYPLYFFSGKTLPGHRIPLYRSVWIRCCNFFRHLWMLLRCIAVGGNFHGFPSFKPHPSFYRQNRVRQQQNSQQAVSVR